MDFQPVLMAAGRGGRLAPLGDRITKCLVTIGNIPMMWFPLRSLDLAGFNGEWTPFDWLSFSVGCFTLQSVESCTSHCVTQLSLRHTFATASRTCHPVTHLSLYHTPATVSCTCCRVKHLPLCHLLVTV